MSRKIDLTGQIFGDLYIVKFLRLDNYNKSYYLCRCTCGKEKPIRIDHLRSGKTISCGHVGNQNSVNSSITHNLSRNPLYHVWYQMMTRCYNEKFVDYNNYGGRGIQVCAEWFDISKFVIDMEEGYKKGLQIDRIDNNGWYCKENCRWSTRSENNRNKRNNHFIEYNNERLTIKEWSIRTGIAHTSICGRLKRGLTGGDAIFGVKKYVV